MPYHIENNNAACSGFAVVKDDDGEVMGCHRSQAQAERQMAALYAAEDIDEEDDDEEEIEIEITISEGMKERASPYTPTQEMIDEAEQGLEWREEYNRGGTEIGIARARDIINRRNLSEDTLRRMISFFARHEIDKEGQGFRPGETGYPSAGRIAWALWGGDPGRAFATREINALDATKGTRRQEVERILADLRAIR